MKNLKRVLDKIDLEILAVMFADPSLSNKDIAMKVKLAPSSSLERIKKLQSDGIIETLNMQVNLQALGGHIQAMISVRLKDHNRATVDNFQKSLLPMNEVLSVFHMGGENDFFVHVTVVDSIHLRDFVFNAITARQEVNHVETALVYDHQISHTLPNVNHQR
ncbi:Lrp/AsnC family transcriptional regulator [Aliiglaciecola sp. 3_MG-2023]|uniref:Lrp/AsnC family transcriptional regulator n=1 Tax=Aliiglaciecola sp. 3_MG-2023 TaxID=3062644 RepID=UPI0026E2C104|nr:Lrp/AsnC family transcriptional regulator [Aliiglaciecola sp. 3_MG-2023]MDO6695134.1 Lrp/AsnC family transcriptional regulator [Aliiglaciecola sp. 3_MG-2023]